jgi:hypothetical protein
MKFDINTITTENVPMRWLRQAVSFYEKYGANADPSQYWTSDFAQVYSKLIEIAIEKGVIAASSATQVAAPTFSPVAGAFASAQNVTLTSATAGAAIYYTTDGSTPTTASTLYTAPVTINGGAPGVLTTTVIKAYATKPSSTLVDSAVVSAEFDITIPAAVATPTFSPVAGAFASAQTVTLASTTAGAAIYYTTDGSTPTTASTLYTAPVTINGGASGVLVTTTVKAIATKTGMTNSAIASAVYAITLP